MSDETEARRGDAAFKEQREAISKRNAEAHRRGQAERRERDRAIETRDRIQAAREAEQLHVLNQQIAKRHGAG